MKKISKLLLSFILVALCFCSIIPFAGCAPKGEAVQSIRYYDRQFGATQLISTCEWEIATENITKSEYDNAPEEYKVKNSNLMSEYIDIDRQAFIAYADAKIDTVVYTYSSYPDNNGDDVYFYHRYTFKSYKLEYVKVNFKKSVIENDSVDIYFMNLIIEVSPFTNGYFNGTKLSYEITYFEN